MKKKNVGRVFAYLYCVEKLDFGKNSRNLISHEIVDGYWIAGPKHFFLFIILHTRVDAVHTY